MKINNTQYATALYEATKDKTHGQINEAISNFVKILGKNNQVKNINNIINKFKEVWNKREKIVEAEVASARKLESSEVHKVEKFLKEKYKAEKVEIIEKMDPSIKGGIIIKVGDEVMDGSIRGYLGNLRKKLSV